MTVEVDRVTAVVVETRSERERESRMSSNADSFTGEEIEDWNHRHLPSCIEKAMQFLATM